MFMRKIYKKAAPYLIALLFAPTVLYLSCVILSVFTFSNMSVFGYGFYVAMSDNMYPAIKPSDVVITRLCGPEDVQEGDMITINSFAYYTVETYKSTCRLVSVLSDENGVPEQLLTKGDTNTYNHDPISADRLIGKVTGRIPWIGIILSIKQQTILLVVVLCWAVAIAMIVLRRRARKRLVK